MSFGGEDMSSSAAGWFDVSSGAEDEGGHGFTGLWALTAEE